MDVTKLFERGSQAFERGSWELAIMLWQQLLSIEPGHLDARRLIREAEVRKWVQDGRGKRDAAMAFIKGIGPLTSLAIHMLTKNYDRVMIDCEKVLIYNPNNALVLWTLIRAATKSEHPEAAIVTLEFLRERNPKNIKALRELARQYEATGEILQALSMWDKVKAILPTDREAQIKMRDLAAEKTMVDGKYESATEKGSTFRESLKSKEDSEDMEQEHRIIRTDDDLGQAIERVTKDVEAYPQQKRYIIQLGDLHRRKKDFNKARELYKRALQIDSMDFSVMERLGELRIDEYTEEEESLSKQIAATPDNAELKTKLHAIQKEKFEFCRQEYKRQTDTRPTDASLHVKLADLFYDVKMFDEAGLEYQKASADPRMYRRCKKRLGLCLYSTGKFQLAANQFEQAAKGGHITTREVRDILYFLGITLEQLGNLEQAEAVYHKIFEADMSYKDVQARLEQIMKRRQKPETTNTGGETP